MTGTLAEPSVRAMAGVLHERFDVDVQVIVLNIQVAALMTAAWVARKLSLGDRQVDRVILPGYCRGDVAEVAQKLGVQVMTGPRDVGDLVGFLGGEGGERREGGEREAASGYQRDGAYDIEMIAEINDAAHLPMAQVIDEAQRLAQDGADVIDIGCDPQSDRPAWHGVGDAVRELRDCGLRVSIDSFHSQEVELACAAGAELVLSVNGGNREAASGWGAEVVVVPDDPQRLTGLDETVSYLERKGVAYRIDPIIEPIGFGFAQSLGRYIETRRRYPDAAMMMGIGNLTEMTGVDSAGVNMLLLGFCQELNIASVLTTQVINWARSSVREIDRARRIMHHAVTHHTVPKHFDQAMVMLRDARLRDIDGEAMHDLASKLTDANIRIFADAQRGLIHAMNNTKHATGDDPFVIFDQLQIDDASHAFYLGYEMAKAVTAITLAKNYTQDEPLEWGMLTRPEISHHERRTSRHL